MEERTIISNRIKTPDGTIIESVHVHDFNCHVDTNGKQYCVDGGKDYLKRSCEDDDYIECSVYSDAPHDEIRLVQKWGVKQDSGHPIFVSISELTNMHIINILITQEQISKQLRKIFNDELHYKNINNINILKDNLKLKHAKVSYENKEKRKSFDDTFMQKNINIVLKEPIYPTGKITKIDELKKFTKELRNFNAEYVLNNKIEAINKFFKDNNLDSVVVGLSGGLDSSLVYKLLLQASSKFGSPIKQVYGIFMPINSNGITGQDTAEKFVDQLLTTCIHYKTHKYSKIDLTNVSNEYRKSLNISNNWVQGQIDSIVRTPVMYGIAAQMQSEGFKSIVAGTTNRDEGAYIGFYGKSSDFANDLQPIMDLHKSEVEKLAELLYVPYSIILRPATGDVYDGSLDETTIGSPYWFLELYQILMENDCRYLVNNITDCSEILTWCLNIELLHNKNLHKYENGKPMGFAKYVDVMKRTLEIIK